MVCVYNSGSIGRSSGPGRVLVGSWSGPGRVLVGYWSGPGQGYCVLGQDTLLSQRLSSPNSINGHRRI